MLFYFNKNNNQDKSKENNPQNTSSTTSSSTPRKDATKYVETISVVNNDYYESICQVTYYIPELIIYENTLYAVIDQKNELTNELETIKINNRQVHKLLDNVKEAYFAESGQCGTTFAFATGNDGKLYYINNYKYSTSKILEVTEIKELSNIVTIISHQLGDEDFIAAYAIDLQNTEHELTDIITKYAKWY